MKSVLIILTRNDQSDLSCNESITALMLFASFGLQIHVLFKDAALSLLQHSHVIDPQLKAFLKPANKMVDSFEFYDIEHLYVLSRDQNHAYVHNSQHTLEPVELDATFLTQFDHIITW